MSMGWTGSHALALLTSPLTGETQQASLVFIAFRATLALVPAYATAYAMWPMTRATTRTREETGASKTRRQDELKQDGSLSLRSLRPDLVMRCGQGLAAVTRVPDPAPSLRITV